MSYMACFQGQPETAGYLIDHSNGIRLSRLGYHNTNFMGPNAKVSTYFTALDISVDFSGSTVTRTTQLRRVILYKLAFADILALLKMSRIN